MQAGTLGQALEREHRDIDGGIEQYVENLAAGSNDPEPLFRAMRALRRHIYLEEEFLFPPMKVGGTMMAIMVMIREHGEIWRQMDALDRLVESGADATTLTDACTTMLEALDKHNSKEEPVIYTKADDALSAEAGGELADFLRTGTMPAGWVAQSA